MKSTMTPFLIIIVCIAAYYMYLSPLYAEIGMVRDEKDKYSEVLEKAKNIGTKRDELLSEYNSIPTEDIEKMKKVVPEVFDAPSLINDLNFLASRYNTSVDKFDFDIPENQNSQVELEQSRPSPYKSIKINFSINATYPQFINFLKDLESNTQIIDVYSIKISPNNQDENSSILGFTVDAYTYTLR